MKDQDQGIEKLGQAWVALADRQRDRGCWLEADQIWDAVRGKLPPLQTRRIVDHLAGCPVCSEAWQLARMLTRDAEVRSALAGWPSWAASAAAGVILLAGLGIFQLISPSDSEAVFRRAGRASIHSLLSEEEALPREDFALAWTQPPSQHKVTYQLTVATETLDVIAEAAGLEAPRYRIPQQRLSNLPSGTLLHWQIKAALEDGSRLDSPTFLTRLQ
ncbi:MAG: zf-HC2 domain-containing protein [Acidobacteriota bacterium]